MTVYYRYKILRYQVEPRSKGLVFLEAQRECSRGILRAAYAPTVWAYAQE